MLCTHSAVINCLFKLLTIIFEFCCSKDTIVRVVLLDLEALLAGKLLKLVFAGNCFLSIGRELTIVEDFVSCMINEQSTTAVALALTSECVLKAARYG